MAEREDLLLFAHLLEYPTAALPQQLRRLRLAHGARLDEFAAFVEREPLVRVRELYTTTFDLSPVCCPYVGYHLFGESFKRGALMAKLRETYAANDFAANLAELPDHLSVILLFAAACEDAEFVREITAELVVPALRTMVAGFESGQNPYEDVLRTLLTMLDSQLACASMGGALDV